jgi:transglutaminase-like putative cysteine protease
VSATAFSRLKIRHVTGFNYDGTARASYNEARMSPPNTARQLVLESRLVTAPNATQWSYVDYFGTTVTSFDLQEPHRQLVVTAEAVVDAAGAPALVLPWRREQFSDPDVVDRFVEYLSPTTRTTLDPSVLHVANEKFGTLDVHEAVAGVIEWIREHVRYVPGSTSVTSTAGEAWSLREGVCQDMTHITIAVLRSLGVPARYVSGYLHPSDSDELGVTLLGQSHAWVEYFSGSWVAIDPTNNGAVDSHHVHVAAGRDYADVPPLKGIYHGEPSRALGVTVEITRLV